MGYPLNIDYRRKLLVQSRKSSAGFQLPPFVQGDALSLDVSLFDWNGVGISPAGDGGPNGYQPIPVGGYSLQVGLYVSPGGNQLAYQNSWSDDPQNNRKSGYFIQNSANVATALTANEVDCYLEIKASFDAGAHYETVLPFLLCKLRKRLIPDAAETVPPNETALSVETADGRYALAVDCRGIIFYNPVTGQRAIFGLQDDGTFGPGPVPA